MFHSVDPQKSAIVCFWLAQLLNWRIFHPKVHQLIFRSGLNYICIKLCEIPKAFDKVRESDYVDKNIALELFTSQWKKLALKGSSRLSKVSLIIFLSALFATQIVFPRFSFSRKISLSSPPKIQNLRSHVFHEEVFFVRENFHLFFLKTRSLLTWIIVLMFFHWNRSKIFKTSFRSSFAAPRERQFMSRK